MNSITYLQDSDNGATITGEVLDTADDIGRVEERLAVRRQEHEQAHGRHRRPLNHSGDSRPHEKVSDEALHRPRRYNHPGPAHPAAPSGSDGGVKEAGEDAGVGADVLEYGHRVER